MATDLWLEIAQLRLLKLGDLMLFLKRQALDLIEHMPGLEITVPGLHNNQTVLRKFQNLKEKQDFIKSHRQAGAWGEDSILLPLLHELGYEVYFHLDSTELPPYLLFERLIEDPATPKKIIHISNSGAKAGGYHWELLIPAHFGFEKIPNVGGGNCMYWVLAQQVIQDLPKINRRLNKPSPPKQPFIPVVTPHQAEKKIIQAAVEKNIQMQPAREPEPVVPTQIKEAEAEWLKYEAATDQSKENIKQYLQQTLKDYSKKDLQALFNAAALNCDSDVYILSWVGKDFPQKKELIDVLGTEAWRNPHFKTYLETQGLNFSQIPIENIKHDRLTLFCDYLDKRPSREDPETPQLTRRRLR